MRATVWLLLVLLLALMALVARSEPPTLHQRQAAFSVAVAGLITHAVGMGYEVTLGEAWRSSEQASFPPQQTMYDAKLGIGIAKSLHTERLAIDLNLFKAGKYLSATSDYKTLGEWWEKQGGSWGGRFKRADGNHFSFSFLGVK